MSRRPILPLVSVALVGLTTACVQAPPRTTPDIAVDVPAAFQQGAVGEVEDDWWVSFGDPALERLIELALERNNDLLAAAARVEQARENAVIAGADLEPNVGFGVDAARQRTNTSSFGGAIPGGIRDFTYSRFGAQFQASWEADLWGRLRAQTRSAIAQAGASAADYQAARLSLAARIADLWFAIAELRQQIELADDRAASFRELSGQVQRRFERGTRPAIDLRLARSNESAARAVLELRRRQLDASVRQLEILIGDYPTADLLGRFATRPLPATPPPIPVGLPADLIARRPDLAAAERRVVAADERYRSARRALYPQLTLTASGGTASAALGDLLDGDFRVWSLAANLVQPLFNGGRLRANVRLNDAASDQALARYAQAVLNAYREVETALAAEPLLVEQERHLTDVAEQLAAAERLSEQRYRRGVGGYFEVLEAQTRAFSAASELLALRRERLSNRIELHLALGGGMTTSGATP